MLSEPIFDIAGYALLKPHELEVRVDRASLAVGDDELMHGLQAAGCDDALVGLGSPDVVALAFTRYAVSARQALWQVLDQLKSVFPGLRLAALEPAPHEWGAPALALPDVQQALLAERSLSLSLAYRSSLTEA